MSYVRLSFVFLAAFTSTSFAECKRNYTLSNETNVPIYSLYFGQDEESLSDDLLAFPLAPNGNMLVELRGKGPMHIWAKVAAGKKNPDGWIDDFCHQTRIHLIRDGLGLLKLNVD